MAGSDARFLEGLGELPTPAPISLLLWWLVGEKNNKNCCQQDGVTSLSGNRASSDS